MRTIRVFEERLHVEFATGEIPGFVHLYAGEEASAAGVMAHLSDEDCIASTTAATATASPRASTCTA
jgi:pyruvate dehydrogenase E1 component alpha subunit